MFVTADRLLCLWITVINIRKINICHQIFMNVIHRQNDEGNSIRKWHISAVSAIILLRKWGSIMAIKYTEEQLNTVDKSFLIQLLLQQQEQLEALTKELQATNEKMQQMMEQIILAKQNRFGRSSEKMND